MSVTTWPDLARPVRLGTGVPVRRRRAHQETQDREAQRRLALAVAFALHFRDTEVGPYRPRLEDRARARDGRAATRQGLLLEPLDGGTPVRAGWIDVTEARGALRTHSTLVWVHRQKHGKALPLDHDDHASFNARLGTFLRARRMRLDAETTRATAERQQAARRRRAWSAVAAGVVIGLATLWLAVWLLMLR